MAVAELVPQIAVAQRRAVAALQQRLPGEGGEHLQMRRVRLVPAGDEAVHDAHAALGVDDEASPAGVGVN